MTAKTATLVAANRKTLFIFAPMTPGPRETRFPNSVADRWFQAAAGPRRATVKIPVVTTEPTGHGLGPFLEREVRRAALCRRLARLRVDARRHAPPVCLAAGARPRPRPRDAAIGAGPPAYRRT